MFTVDQMAAIIGQTDATNEGDATAVARFIVGNIRNMRIRQSDAEAVEFVATALQAYAKLLQENGVKVA